MISSQLYSRIKQLNKKIYENIITEREKISGFTYKPCAYAEKLCDAANCGDGGFMPFGDGDLWGGQKDAHTVFYNDIFVGKSNAGEHKEFAIIFEPTIGLAVNTQYMLYLDGEFLRCIDNEHRSVEIPEGEHKVLVYAYSGMSNEKKVIFKAELITVNEETKRLYYNIATPFSALEVADRKDDEYFALIDVLSETLNLVDFDEGEEKFYTSVKRANEYIESKLYDAPAKHLGGKACVSCLSHTHIDVGWLWTVRQTEEKAVRSFSNVIYNMERYGDFSFMSSQPILFYFVKKHCPELYRKVKQRVKEGRFIPEGSAWVEADCNLTSGESLVRQIIYGKRFFKEEFGVDNRLFWLPDVFGYAFALPQILKKCGIDTFITTKISWNDTNTMPYDTFLWRGLDGSEILTYFVTAQNYKETYPGPELDPERLTTYVAQGTPRYVKGTYVRYSDKKINNDALMLFGFGDGGGTACECDYETITRLKNGMLDVPPARFVSLGDFFDRLHEKCDGNKDVPVWDNELYLEFHRGTYTSVARVKKNNRKAEFALLETENLLAMNYEETFLRYPKAELDELWIKVLTNQFHDILPGSAIKEVYEKTDEDYAYVFSRIDDLQREQIGRIVEKTGAKEGFVVVNATSFGGDFTLEESGVALDFKGIPPKGYAILSPEMPNDSVQVKDHLIENDFFVLEFDENYDLKSIFDKRKNRELIRSGERGNVIRIYDDYPPEVYDAWDIRDYYGEKYRDLTEIISVTPVKKGAKSGLEIVKKYRNSVFRQCVYLFERNERIDFETKVDWHEKHRFVKALFPLDLNAFKATYDIQFGNLERNSVNGNSWDRAKFECCGQKFADISESDYGVALMNDCKYGYSFIDGTIGLSLLKSADYPNVEADEGKHEFIYSLYPHFGALRSSDVYKQAFSLNAPPTAIKLSNGKPDKKAEFSFISCDKDNIIIETVKKAENENAVVVRCYDVLCRRVTAKFRFGFGFKELYECDMLENDLSKLSDYSETFDMEIKPFEIKTLKFTL